MMTRAAFLVAALAMLNGCGHTEAHAALLRPPLPPATGSVELYLANQSTPARPFYDVALVQAIGFGSEATPEQVARALTNKAASLGCDAVVRATIDVGYTRAHAAGVCVKYVGAAPPNFAPPVRGELPAAPPPQQMTPAPAPRLEPLPSAPQGPR